MEQQRSGVAIAFELTEVGARMVEARHRREHPDASEAEVPAHVRAWWLDRPGAPDGDCIGRPRDRSALMIAIERSLRQAVDDPRALENSRWSAIWPCRPDPSRASPAIPISP